MSSDSSFNIHNALYFVKYPSGAAQNSVEGRRRPVGRGLKTPGLMYVKIKTLPAVKGDTVLNGPSCKAAIMAFLTHVYVPNYSNVGSLDPKLLACIDF